MQVAGEPGPHIFVGLLCLALIVVHAAWPTHFLTDWVTVALAALLAAALLLRAKAR